MRDRFVVQRGLGTDLFGQPAEPRAENDAHAGSSRPIMANDVDGFPDLRGKFEHE